MIAFPAIDIKDGQCVRLFQGKADAVTVYGDSPAEMAKQWVAQGAEYIHVVDLDGAFSGQGVNKSAVEAIVNSVSVPVQLGGGIRTYEAAASWLELGVARVILGTVAVKDPDLLKRLVEDYGDRIVVSLDCKDGMVTVDGWVAGSNIKAVDYVKTLEMLGVKTIVYTDIATDGTLAGPNQVELRAIMDSTSMDVIASGGIGCQADVMGLQSQGFYGAIIGKALYEKRIEFKSLKEALC